MHYISTHTRTHKHHILKQFSKTASEERTLVVLLTQFCTKYTYVIPPRHYLCPCPCSNPPPPRRGYQLRYFEPNFLLLLLTFTAPFRKQRVCYKCGQLTDCWGRERRHFSVVRHYLHVSSARCPNNQIVDDCKEQVGT